MPVFSERRRKRLKSLASQRLRIDPFTDDALPVREAKEGGLVRLVHDIWEGETPYPVVTHTFTGRDRKEAEAYFKAHLKTDKFMASMEKSGKFGDIVGRTKKVWR